MLILLLVWLASGFYQVQPSEQGVVLRFGAYNRTTDAGLHYHLPYPIESVDKVSITQERSITLGVTEAYDASIWPVCATAATVRTANLIPLPKAIC